MGFEEIFDQESLSRLMNTFSQSGSIPVSIHYDGGFRAVEMTFRYRKKGNMKITFGKNNCNFTKGYILKVSFLFQEVLFNFETEILEETENYYIVSIPKKIFTSSKRMANRYKLSSDEDAYIKFPNIQQRYKIVDISTRGLSFNSSKRILNSKKVIKDLEITLYKNAKFYVDAKVTYCRKNRSQSYTYGLYFIEIGLESYYKLFKYISKKLNNDLKTIDEVPLGDIYSLYDQSKHISLNWNENSKNFFTKRLRKLYKLKEKSSIFSSIIQYKYGKLLNVGSTIRIYNKTFLCQDFLSTPEASLNIKSKAYAFAGLVNTILNHPYFKYFIYYNKDSAWNDTFEGVETFINNKNNFMFRLIELYEFDSEGFKRFLADLDNNLVDTIKLKPLNKPDEFIKFCTLHMNELELNCYDYSAKLFNLSAIKQVYEALGLLISRVLWKVYDKERTLAYVVVERFSESADVTGFNALCRIYFTEQNVDVKPILKKVLFEAYNFYKKYNTKTFNIMFKPVVNRYYNIDGLRYSGKIGHALMNKEGLLHFKKIMVSGFEKHIKFYPLSYSQRSILNIERAYPGTSICNVAGTIKLEGNIDYHLLEVAINVFIEKNDAMRIRLLFNDDQMQQYITKFTYRKIDFYDFSNKPIEEFYKWEEQKTSIPFRLNDLDLFWFAIIKISDEDTRFYLNAHHIIVDGWSMSLVGTQILEYYYLLKKNESLDSIRNPSYTDYILNEADYKYSEKFQRSKEFWNSKFDDIPELTYLKEGSSAIINLAAERKTFVISNDIFCKIRNFCRTSNASVFTLFMSVMYLYIYRITTKQDIVLGTPILNRSSIREKDTVGMFISNIPVRLKLDGNMNFKNLLDYTGKELMNFFKHQKYPFEGILKDFREKLKTRGSLYDTVISYQNSSFDKSETDKYVARWHFNKNQIEALILHINDRDGMGQYVLNFDYRLDAFSDTDIDTFYKTFMFILKQVIENPFEKLDEINIVSEQDKNKILNDFNNTKREYPKHKTVHEIFSEKVKRYPFGIALEFDGRNVTYKELDELSNRIARTLIKSGVKREEIVAIMVERSIEMIAGILGIIKSGGAYLPIDPNYPKDRIDFMLEDSKTKILLIQKRFANLKFDGHVIILEEGSFEKSVGSIENVNTPEDLIYIIYTSGSTGRPKGVMIEHKSVVNILYNLNKMYPVSREDAYLLKTTYTFDVSVTELFGWFFGEGRLVILKPGREKDIDDILETIYENKVTHLNFVPSMMRAFLEYVEYNFEKMVSMRSLKYLFVAGEALTIDLVKKFHKLFRNVLMENLYGPTEATIYATGFSIKDLECKNTTNVPIGRPLSNTTAYILDKNNQILSIGVPGELCIGGVGVARGYLNNDELTLKKFIQNPYLQEERIYKTGDLVKWCEDGNIEYLGRIDNQVKIRGFRIELGEIEACLLDYPLIQQAVVVPLGEENKYLCAYIISSNNADAQHIKRFLANTLPEYMIPAFIIKVNEFPLTSSGKLNKSALPKPDESISENNIYVAPKTNVEIELVKIWEEVLKINNIGINYSFFDIGGDSLKAIELISKINKEFDVQLTFKDVFMYPCIKDIVNKCVSFKNKRFYKEIEKVSDAAYYPLSSAQKRMFLLYMIENSVNYNMPACFIIEGEINISKLEGCFRNIIKRHEILRTSFSFIDGEPVQTVHDNVEFNIKYVENKDMITEFVKPFDLTKPYLINVVIVKTSVSRYFMLVDLHHIIADGTSLKILIKELDLEYRGYKVAEPKIQYKDFVKWQEEFLKSNEINKQKNYWLKTLKGELTDLSLPLDYERPSTQSFQGEVLKFELETKTYKYLRTLCQINGTTIFMALFSAYNILLYLYSGQENIIIGTPVLGRQHPDAKDLIGMFINTLPIRSKLQENKIFKDFLLEVKDSVLGAFQNQDYPFEKIIEVLNVKRDLARNPLFDTIFYLDTKEVSEFEIGPLRFKNQQIDFKISKFDISLRALEKEDKITFEFEYAKDLFKDETIEKMKVDFVKIVEQVSKNPYLSLSELKTFINQTKKFNNRGKKENEDLNNIKNRLKNSIDNQVMEIWQEILNKDNLSIESNFFEIGGDSLLAIKMLMMMKKQNINVTIQDIYRYQTIRELSDNIESTQQEDAIDF